SGACYAVGYRVDTGSSGLYAPIYALTETWTGGRWMLQPAPALAKYNSLRAVSCLSTSVCFATGDTFYYDSAYDCVVCVHASTLPARWNGSSWSTVYTPNPTGVS